MKYVALGIFMVAIVHTFATKYFEHRAHTSVTNRGLWHLLGEVEIVFGLWAMVLFVSMSALRGTGEAISYLDSRNFTEPLFVFAIMTVAATRPILSAVSRVTLSIGRLLPLPGAAGVYFVTLAGIPLLGSLITEPAAMTLAALMIGERFFAHVDHRPFRYLTLAVLLVNVSIGGTLTSFAAPPILMVAEPWQWSSAFVLSTFGWKAALAVLINATLVTVWFRRVLGRMAVHDDGVDGISSADGANASYIPRWVTAFHFVMLGAIVAFAHHPVVFLGIFLLFLGLVQAYPQYQGTLILKEALLVSFFLAGLVVLGGMQHWWLQPVLQGMSSHGAFWGAVGLTALTDNAALTYLGAQVSGLSDEFKYMLVAGAVSGGGLTIIANAPNPAGIAILKRYFQEGSVSATLLLKYALLPTLVAILAFLGL